MKARVIKFRFWTPDKRMLDDHEGWVEDIGINYALELSKNYGYITMQFTGLKDKNEKDIYENDITKCIRTLNDETIDIHIGVVKWDELHCNFYFHSIQNEISRSVGGKEVIEVLGNIYENPDLLTQLSKEK